MRARVVGFYQRHQAVVAFSAFVALAIAIVAFTPAGNVVRNIVQSECQESPRCRAFVRAEANRAIAEALAERDFVRPSIRRGEPLRQGGDATGPPSGGGPPGGGEPPRPPVTEVVDEAVNDVTDTVDEAVDGATDTACDLTQNPDALC